MAVHKISPELLTLGQVDKILKEGMTLELSQESRDRIVIVEQIFK